jgi:uncharacterized protein YeaO (DUF488 family)
MLLQATTQEVQSGQITKKQGYLLVATRYYPRFLRRNLIDEYASHLAPNKNLLTEFKFYEKKLDDHNCAFNEMQYEKKFTLTGDGCDDLKKIGSLSRKKDVYLICYCRRGERCHRELLMLMARDLYGTPIGRLYNSYPQFQTRLNNVCRYPDNFSELFP